VYVHARDPQARRPDADHRGPGYVIQQGDQGNIIESDAQQLTVAVDPVVSFQDAGKEWASVLGDSPVGSIFLSPQWQEVWWDNFSGGREMTGFSVPASNGGMDALASLSRLGDSISFVGAPDTFDYNDFLVRPGFEDSFYPTLLDVLGRWEWSEVRLDSLIEHSPTLARLPDLARERGYAVEVEYEDVTSGVSLPGDWEEYLALLSKKDRHELRRKLRRLESQTDWRWYCLTSPDDVEANFDGFLALMRMSRADKEEYMTPERERFFRTLARRMAELDLIRLFFMEIDGARAAASLCFDYDRTRLLYNSGYDPGLSYYSVGLLLHAMCVRDAIENNLGYFDFLRGPEPYKAHLGGIQKSLYRMVVKRS
jgi:CelD/BcsL family acetyltransferase involved in cellulose biosynthesis